MGYTISNQKKQKQTNKQTNKQNKTKQIKTKLNLLASSRKGFTKGDDMFGCQGWPLFGPPVIFTPTCAACITSYV